MANHYRDHLLCASCGVFHRVRDGPCEGCNWVACPKCGYYSRAAPLMVCSNRFCRDGKGNRMKFELNGAELARFSHPEGMAHCPVCGKKLRRSARDKRRSIGLKD